MSLVKRISPKARPEDSVLVDALQLLKEARTALLRLDEENTDLRSRLQQKKIAPETTLEKRLRPFSGGFRLKGTTIRALKQSSLPSCGATLQIMGRDVDLLLDLFQQETIDLSKADRIALTLNDFHSPRFW